MADWRVLQGDCLELLPTLAEDSVDAVVTDPPYGLEFMGKEWDRLANDPVSSSWNTKGRTMTGLPDGADYGKAKLSPQPNPRCRKCGRTIRGRDTKKGFRVCHCVEPTVYLPNTYGEKMQRWHTQWVFEVFRVLKPGGHLVAFGGTRTHHRLWCALEDAGFEIRDTLCWLYGSGFPKSLDVSKAIDKAEGVEREVIGTKLGMPGKAKDGSNQGFEQFRQLEERDDRPTPPLSITAPATDAARQWSGWGTALKPAFEPIVLARKPLSESTVAANVQRWGTGALNVDGCRIGSAVDTRRPKGTGESAFPHSDDNWRSHIETGGQNILGRWPANCVLSHTEHCERVGTKRVKRPIMIVRTKSPHSWFGGVETIGQRLDKGDADGLETVEDWRCVPDCPVQMLEAQSVERLGAGYDDTCARLALFLLQ